MGTNQSASSAPSTGATHLAEFSVVYTAAATNLMSQDFQVCMRDLSAALKKVYHASAMALVPGSGTFAMEAAARQFANQQKVLVVRNGWFSYRWSQILTQGGIALGEPVVHLARPRRASDPRSTWSPPPIDEVVASIRSEKPKVVFAPHVETANGIILPPDYVLAIGQACREVDALFVLDCIASGAMWVNMEESLVDVLISAPQKAWSGPACCGYVFLQDRAVKALATTTSSSFSLDLKKWVEVMKKYEDGSFMYYTTLPTDALLAARQKVFETHGLGLDNVQRNQIELGQRIRELLARRGFTSVAAPGFEAPGVVVVHSPSNDMVARFAKQGVQIAGFVPFQCNEHKDLMTFRVGLFGLEKFNIEATVATFSTALATILDSSPGAQL